MTKILVVDDNKDTVDLLKTILLKHGYKVETAFNGKECLSKIEKNGFDLITLDVMMPDMSGWDVFQKIKNTHHKVKVVFLSIIEVFPKRKKKLLMAGISDYIQKPFTEESLMKRITSIVK